MWYNEYGKDGDVVLSSRVRLARNIKDIPFPPYAKEKEQSEVINRCKSALLGTENGDKIAEKYDLKYIDMADMKPYEKQAIAECHLISPQMIKENRKRGLILSGDSRISVMINEEDHMRIQSMDTGFMLDECYADANEIDDYVENSIDYAFDNDFGYLTCCPTNVGTGLRASVMVHLPGYVLTGKFGELATSLSQLGLTVRGIYGEGSKGLGNIFQISNQITLGIPEEDIIDRLKQIVCDVINNERELRQMLYKNDRYRIEDKIRRSYGILKNAVIMTSNEAMKRLSDIRLGISLNLIDDIKYEQINEITYLTLPANIVKNHNTTNEFSRDLKRAEIIKERMC